MSGEKLISVVIPCYNHERYIKKTVLSALQQTYTNIEVLVADDCSTDGSVEVLKEIKDPRLKTFFFSCNRGTVYTLNFLLKQAKGEYIATLGSDDYFSEDKLEKQIRVMEDKPELGAVFSWVSIIDGNDNQNEDDQNPLAEMFNAKNRSRAEWIRYFCTEGNCLCHSSAVVRRKVQDQIGMYNASYRQVHDFDYWLRILCAYPIYVIPEKLTLYRRVDDKTSVSASKSVGNMRRLFNEYTSVFLMLFRELNKELFLEAFSDVLTSPWDDDSVLEKEKYFVLRNLAIDGCKIPNAAQDFFVNCIDEEMLTRMSPKDHAELLSMYYEDTAKIAVEYPVTTVTEKIVKLVTKVGKGIDAILAAGNR